MKYIKPFFFLSFVFTLFSCKKDDIIPKPSPIKSAKFEITGTYSGNIFLVYNNNLSGNTTLTITSLPWSKTIDYASNVQGIGISGNAVFQSGGSIGQTASLKIYNGNNIVAQSNKISDANGVFNFDALAYVFP
ncbi:MAG: hypothetical protein HOO89_08380 [Ferruginibacter sp.]|nr:hypothetical protein [Ferruginibacter sp.]